MIMQQTMVCLTNLGSNGICFHSNVLSNLFLPGTKDGQVLYFWGYSISSIVQGTLNLKYFKQNQYYMNLWVYGFKHGYSFVFHPSVSVQIYIKKVVPHRILSPPIGLRFWLCRADTSSWGQSAAGLCLEPK
jgi:hypothetical protein